MAITFNGSAIPGQHKRIQRQPPEFHAVRHKFAGIWGEREINLGLGGRLLETYIWINDASFTSVASVVSFHDQLDLKVGVNGNLLVTDDFTGAIVNFFNVCTFLGFEQTIDILPVIGPGMAGSFWMAGFLRWRNLELNPGP